MVKDGSIKKFSVGLLIMSIVVSGLFLLIRYRNEIHFKFPNFLILDEKQEGISTKGVPLEIISNLDKETLLELKMTIPCINNKERKDLERKLPQIKSEFLTSLDQSEMREWVSQRNFEAIKEGITKIVNHHSQKPVKTVYFDDFIIY